MQQPSFALCCALCVLACAACVLAAPSSDFVVDSAADTTPFPHFWEECVGSCHAATAMRADWQAELTRSHKELGFKYVRFHGLFDDDMSVVVNGRYSFVLIDSVFDFLRSIDMRPLVELSFMPSALASGSNTVFWYKGNITPPKNMADWNKLIDAFVRHCIERYGLDEVAQWYFEVWNEPNLGTQFWTGGQAGYFTLLQNTANTIHAVSPRLRVGGPASSGAGWIAETMAAMKAVNVTLDFISTHTYPTDGGDHRTIVQSDMKNTKATAGSLPVLFTEWSSGLMDASTANHDTAYAAAFYAKVFPEIQGYVEIASIWTFSDIFEENGQNAAPFSNQYGMVTIIGVPKPAFRALQQLRVAGDERVPVHTQSSHSHSHSASPSQGRHHRRSSRHTLGHDAAANAVNTTGCWALRNSDANTLTTIAYQYDYYDYRAALVPQSVAITINAVAKRCNPNVTLALIDDTTVGPRAAWQAMGSPTYPTHDQIAAISKASEVVVQPLAYVVEPASGDIQVHVTLQPYAVAFITTALDCM